MAKAFGPKQKFFTAAEAIELFKLLLTGEEHTDNAGEDVVDELWALNDKPNLDWDSLWSFEELFDDEHGDVARWLPP